MTTLQAIIQDALTWLEICQEQTAKHIRFNQDRDVFVGASSKETSDRKAKKDE